MKPSIGDVVILSFKAHNQIAAGQNSSKVPLFRQETNLLNVTRRKLLRRPDRNICGKGKSILNHKESRKGDHIDVQPAIKKKKRQRSPKPLQAKTENVTAAIRNDNAPGKELALLLPFAANLLDRSFSERRSLHVLSHHPRAFTRTSPTFLLRILLSPALLAALLRASLRHLRKLHTASEMLLKRMRGEARGHRACSPRPEMVGEGACVRGIISRVLRKNTGGRGGTANLGSKWTLH